MHKRTYVDYSEAGHEKQVAGRSFMVRYAVVDHFGDKVYYFEEREREHVVKNAEVRFVLTFYGHTGRRLKGETKTKRATYLKR